MSWDVQEIRQQFPALIQQINGRPVVYLDNACMTAKPRAVLQAMEGYYLRFPGCHGRAAHTFGRLTTDAYEGARQAIARLLGAPAGNLVFTKNTTEAINLVAAGLPWREGDAVLISDMEHNSNLLPWLALARTSGVEVLRFPLAPDTTFDAGAFQSLLTPRVRLVSLFHTSNVTGVSLPVREITELAHKNGSLVLLDASQGVGLERLDAPRLGVDFLALSMHKVLGPTGVGVLYGAGQRLQELRPLLFGGEMVADVDQQDFTLAGIPDRFEAGLQNYAGAIGAGAAADMLRSLPLEQAREHVIGLNRLATEGLSRLKGLSILGPMDPALRHGVVNFHLDGVPADHLARILDQSRNIMVRSGFHCAHSWYHARGIGRTVRASFFFYNTPDEARALVRSVEEVTRFF